MKITKKVKSTFLICACLVLSISSCKKIDEAINSDDERENILNTWTCKESIANGASSSYIVDITKSDDDKTTVYLDNLFQLNGMVKATMNGYSLQIPSQTINGWTLKGSGSIASNYQKITLNFTADDGSGDIQNVTATLSEYPAAK